MSSSNENSSNKSKKEKLSELKRKRTKIKNKERFFNNLFIFLLFLIIVSFFYSQIQKEKIDNSIYYGKFATYYKSLDNGEKRWFYSFILNNKRIDVPLYSDPKTFENISVKFIKKPVLNRNIVIVFDKKDNLSVITTASFNLARVLVHLGYFSNKNLFVSYLDNNTIKVVNSSFNIIAKGPLDCNSDLTTFIVLNASTEKNNNEILFNNSCIFLEGDGKGLLEAVDLFDVLLTRKYNVK